MVCLDLEGVLVPEIWTVLARSAGIPELERTTRDEPDYDRLMAWRLEVVERRGLTLPAILESIASMEPFPGAREFLDALRSEGQVVIVSDTFEQFAAPLLEKLGRPTILCNTLEVRDDGAITGWRMRCRPSKLTTVRALHAMGYDTIAAGDSYNDLDMLRAGKAGFLFRPTPAIRAANPDLPAYEHYEDLLEAIRAAR